MKRILCLLLFCGQCIAAPFPQYVYKILTLSEWHYVQRHEFSADFTTAEDKSNGFIRLCSKNCAKEWEHHFSGKQNGVIIKLDYQQMATQTRWVDINGVMEPHYYGTIERVYLRNAKIVAPDDEPF